jgi:integrase
MPYALGTHSTVGLTSDRVLPSSDAQLLVETDIESGLRWGELTELRVKDIDFATGVLTVSRALIMLSRKNHPEGGRFLSRSARQSTAAGVRCGLHPSQGPSGVLGCLRVGVQAHWISPLARGARPRRFTVPGRGDGSAAWQQRVNAVSSS